MGRGPGVRLLLGRRGGAQLTDGVLGRRVHARALGVRTKPVRASRHLLRQLWLVEIGGRVCVRGDPGPVGFPVPVQAVDPRRERVFRVPNQPPGADEAQSVTKIRMGLEKRQKRYVAAFRRHHCSDSLDCRSVSIFPTTSNRPPCGEHTHRHWREDWDGAGILGQGDRPNVCFLF